MSALNIVNDNNGNPIYGTCIVPENTSYAIFHCDNYRTNNMVIVGEWPDSKDVKYMEPYVNDIYNLNNNSENITALKSYGILDSCDFNTLYGKNNYYLLTDSKSYVNSPEGESKKIAGILICYTLANWTFQFIWYLDGTRSFKRAGSSATNWRDWGEFVGGNSTTNEYVTNHYENTYNITATPQITSTTEYYLQSTNDNTDRTAEIQTLLNSNKVVRFGPGDFYTTGIYMPEGSAIYGAGSATKIYLLDSVTEGYTIRVNSYCTVDGLFLDGITGRISEIDETNYKRHGLLIEGTYNEDQKSPYRINISNLIIERFNGGGITCYNTGYNEDTNFNVCNVYVYNCSVGIYMPYWAEYYRFTNVSCNKCTYGSIMNGGNNSFINCGFTSCLNGIFMDNTDSKSPNNGHGQMVGCIFNHTGGNQGIGIKMINIHNGFVFSGCNMFFSQIDLKDTEGVVFNAFNTGLNNCIINIDNCKSILFTDSVVQGQLTKNITNSTGVVFDNVYIRSTGAMMP